MCGRERHWRWWCYSTCERTQPFGGTSRAGCCRSACSAGCRNHYYWLSVLFRHVWQTISLAPRAPLRSPTRWRMRPTCGAFTWQVCLSFAAEAIASFTAPCHRQRDWNGVESARTGAVCCRSMLYQAPPRVGYVRYVGRKRHGCAAIAPLNVDGCQLPICRPSNVLNFSKRRLRRPYPLWSNLWPCSIT